MLSIFARLRSLLRGIRRHDALNRDMDTEFRHHMELRAIDLVRGGMTPAEAARKARLEFGSTESFKDSGRAARGLRWFDSLRFSMLDVKLGARMLRKHPGLTVIGTIAVAFAIAVGTVAFEVVVQVLFPTIPLPQGDAIVGLQNWHIAASAPVNPSRRDFVLWKNGLTTITDLSAVVVQDRNVAVGIGPGEPIGVADVTASTFAMTRVPALLGRTLLPADEQAGGDPVVVIGYDFWKNRLAGAPDVVGRMIRVSGTATKIVGVMPHGYAFPRRHAVWRPLHLEQLPEDAQRLRYVFGRVAPGHSRDEARAEFAAIGERSEAMFPETHKNLRGQVLSVAEEVFRLPDATVILPLVNVFLVLLLALVCGNVALLLFARAASRQTEILVRSALGASRGRIIMQLFAEALVLCTVGAMVGLIASNRLLQWVWAMADGQRGPLPFWMGTSLSPTTIVYAIGLTLLAAAIAGVVPAIKVTAGGIDARLRAMSSGGGGLQFGGVWTGIIVTQIALTVTLPLVTGFMQADQRMASQTPAGFAADEYLTATIGLDRVDGAAAVGDTIPAVRAARLEVLYRALSDRLEREPGVLGVTYASAMPLMSHNTQTIEMNPGPVAPRDPAWPDGYRVASVSVDPRFFDVIGTPVVQGRSLTNADAEQPSDVVVNESFVKLVLGGHNPIGRQFRYGYFLPGSDHRSASGNGPWNQIVGVVPDLGVPQYKGGDAKARIYFASLPKNTEPLRIAIHVRGDPARFAPRLRELAGAVDPALRVTNPLPLPRVRETEAEFGAFWIRLLVGLSIVTLVLSLAGIYAVTAFAVAKRTREIGVRVALGARPDQILTTVFKRPLIQIALGVLVGATFIVRIVTVADSSLDWRAFARLAVDIVAIAVVCMLACIVPAKRALDIQPTEALKDEG